METQSISQCVGQRKWSALINTNRSFPHRKYSNCETCETQGDIFNKLGSKRVTTLNYTDLGSPFGSGGSAGGSNTPTPTTMAAGEALDSHHHHLLSSGSGPPAHQDSSTSGNITPVPTSKSAFIELQQHPYNPSGIRSAYHPHHFNPHQPGGQPNSGAAPHHHSVDPAGFGSPRTALSAYPFPPMHQNSYTGYHLGSYAPQCPSPPKDGE